jgi:outer membrane protein assembly factor BamB
MLFILALVLLIALSGGSLYFIARKPTLSPAQVTATSVANRATATAEARPYATGTANMFGFDAAHTHNNPYEHTLNPTNVSRLTPLWSFATGDHIDSSPAVAGGMIYVGSHNHKLYAFDASCRATCLPLWTFSTGNVISSSPAVANGMVYVSSEDHKLYAFGLEA